MENARALRGRLRIEALMRMCCYLALLGTAQGQFFSKTTDTIPRMGRRDLDYTQMEEPRLGRMLGFFRADPARQSAAIVDVGYLLGADGVMQNRGRAIPTNGCHGSRCRAAVLPTLQAIDGV